MLNKFLKRKWRVSVSLTVIPLYYVYDISRKFQIDDFIIYVQAFKEKAPNNLYKKKNDASAFLWMEGNSLFKSLYIYDISRKFQIDGSILLLINYFFLLLIKGYFDSDKTQRFVYLLKIPFNWLVYINGYSDTG